MGPRLICGILSHENIEKVNALDPFFNLFCGLQRPPPARRVFLIWFKSLSLSLSHSWTMDSRLGSTHCVFLIWFIPIINFQPSLSLFSLNLRHTLQLVEMSIKIYFTKFIKYLEVNISLSLFSLNLRHVLQLVETSIKIYFTKFIKYLEDNISLSLSLFSLNLRHALQLIEMSIKIYFSKFIKYLEVNISLSLYFL